MEGEKKRKERVVLFDNDDYRLVIVKCKGKVIASPQLYLFGMTYAKGLETIFFTKDQWEETKLKIDDFLKDQS